VLLRDGVIAAVGTGLATTGEVVEARGCLVTPGLVNTHHHLYQTLTRAVPGGQDALLFGWLKTLYPIWARFGPEEMRVSAQVGLAELALRAAPPRRITSTFTRTARGSTTPSRRRARWACGSTRRAGR
jgi:cytosine/adenosine deaminase-related metal-dependent hydrolase